MAVAAVGVPALALEGVAAQPQALLRLLPAQSHHPWRPLLLVVWVAALLDLVQRLWTSMHRLLLLLLLLLCLVLPLTLLFPRWYLAAAAVAVAAEEVATQVLEGVAVQPQVPLRVPSVLSLYLWHRLLPPRLRVVMQAAASLARMSMRLTRRRRLPLLLLMSLQPPTEPRLLSVPAAPSANRTGGLWRRWTITWHRWTCQQAGSRCCSCRRPWILRQ